jgi:pimeloyl-ACP methyl ester carboxylesterase
MPLHHEIAGAGPPVLLVHAGVADSRMWEPQWHALAAAHTVIRCDLRGFGRSPLPETPWTNADDLAEVLEVADVERAAVVGASYGGLVALELASRHPARVERLVLLSAAFDSEPDPAFAAYAEEEERLIEAGEVAEAVELNVRTWVQPEVDEQARELVRDMQRRAFELQLARPDAEPEDVEIDLAAITVPVTIVTGERDFPTFHRIAEQLERELPEARRIHLDWAGHLPSLERPEETAALLTASLARWR